MNILEIKNLCVSVEGKKILKSINLSIGSGEIHALMGPNGSGKSTLASTLAGHPAYTITQGLIFINGKNITNLKPEERSIQGLFLAFQYPVSVTGLTVEQFLRSAVNAHKRAAGKSELSPAEFRELMNKEMQDLQFNIELVERNLNDGFSGGEKKRLEILQLVMLQPKIAILDETDSGLDVDAIKIVAKGVSKLAAVNTAVLIITHYQRILHFLLPTHVHIMSDGKIIESGGPQLVTKIENGGYSQFKINERF